MIHTPTVRDFIGPATLQRVVVLTFTKTATGEVTLRLPEAIETALDRARGEEERRHVQTDPT